MNLPRPSELQFSRIWFLLTELPFWPKIAKLSGLLAVLVSIFIFCLWTYSGKIRDNRYITPFIRPEVQELHY
jgi:uncharacterized membrane protein